MSTIKLLRKDFDLTVIGDQELATTMMEACATYTECRHGLSTATGEAWDRVMMVAKEITRGP